MIFMIKAQVSKTLSYKDKKKSRIWAPSSAGKWNSDLSLPIHDISVLQEICFVPQ